MMLPPHSNRSRSTTHAPPSGACSGVLRRQGRRCARAVGLSIPVLALLLLPGCATVGHDFPVSYVSSIEKGVTTQTQIHDRFGDPWRVGVEDGQTTWTYGKYKYRMFGQPSTTDLVVRFDNAGVVASYSFSTTEHETMSGN